MQAATCATSLTSGWRSRRAISESCRVAGTASDDDPASSTVLVSSSTNSGTPSVLATICSTKSGGSSRPAVTLLMIAAVGSRPSRFSVSRVTCGCPPSPCRKVGRAVSRNITLELGDAVERLLDQLERGRVDPVQVLEQAEHRPRPRQPEELSRQRRQRPRTLLLRREIEARVTAFGVYPEQRREERRHGCHLDRCLAQDRLELVEAQSWRIARIEAGCLIELTDDRPERAVDVVGRALVPEPQVRPVGQGVEQPLRDARLADPGLADEQHALALAGLGLPPALEQERQFLVAPDHRQRGRAVPRLEAAAGTALAQDPEGADRPGQAAQGLRPQVLEVERPAQQRARVRRDHHLPGLRDRLQPGGEVGRLADDGLLPCRAFAHEVADHHKPGRDPDPHGQRFALRCREVAHRGHHGKPGPHGALGFVLVRPGPAEVAEDAVAHQLGHVTLEPGDLARDGVLVGAQDSLHVLGVEARRQRRRADEVDEHDRELPSFGFGRPGARGGVRCRRGRGFGRRSGLRRERVLPQGGDGGEQLAPVADRGDAEADQVVGRQIGQDLGVDIVVTERLLVLAQAQPVQPSPDVHPRPPARACLPWVQSIPNRRGARHGTAPAECLHRPRSPARRCAPPSTADA